MKKVHYVLYICDDEIFFLNVAKDKIMKETFKSLKEDQIINSNLFIEEFSKFIKKNHIKMTLFGENICVIKNKNINNVVLEKYQEVLKEYYNKIEFKDLENILKIDKETSFININKHYIDYYYKKQNENISLRIHLDIFNGNLKKTLCHIITNIYKPKKMIVFGKEENIPKIAENINHDYNIMTTFPEFHYNYILEEYKN